MSGITPEVWADMGEKAIVTALDIIDTAGTRETSGSDETGQEAPAGWELRSV